MKKALIGAGGHAREVLFQMSESLPCFVDDAYATDNTLPLSKFDPQEYIVMVAIANCEDRQAVIKRLPKETKYFTFIHPTVIIKNNTLIGEGSFIGAYSIITTNISFGKHCLLSRGNQIGHDSMIGDYFSAMPGAIVSGNVTIGSCVYLGTNSSIKEKLSICDDVTIGLNTGIVKNIIQPGVYYRLGDLNQK